ncbi:MAG: tetratricopeptide repeat protein, partial [Calditrichae bacterium]|nr:tetratricopeptide repeat protein [Calditrichia bacterium]
TAISLNPNLYEAIYNLAILQEHLGDNEEAVENFTKFIDVVPRSHQNYLQKAKEKVNTLNKN